MSSTTIEAVSEQSAPPQRVNRRGTGQWLLLGVAVALAVAGSALAAGILRAGSGDGSGAAARSGPALIGDSVKTSFGVIAVESVAKMRGPTAKELSGVTHGIQSLVPPNKTQVEVVATMTNVLHGPASYSPRQFSLLDGKRRVHFTRTNILPGMLQPGAAIEARFSFVVPRNGGKLLLAFRDARLAKPILIDLGKTDTAPAGTGNGHGH